MTPSDGRARRIRGVALALSVGAAHGCFDDFRDRTCDDTNTDCFSGERCVNHRCEPGADAEATPADATPSLTLIVRVYERPHGTELPSATVDFDPNEGLQCSCLASASSGPCSLTVPATGTVRVCARASGHRACARPEIPTSIGEVYITLDACRPGQPCDDTPGACGCAGLPTCGTLSVD